MSGHRGRRRGVGGLRAAVVVALVAGSGCFPTVRLGRDDAAATETETETSLGTVDPSAVSSGALDGSGTMSLEGGPPDTSPATGVDPSAGMGTGVDPDTGMGPGPAPESTGSDTASDTGAATCEAQDTDNACLTCAREACCAELELCADQVPCNCFVECLGMETMPDPTPCQMKCGDSSGIAALEVCLAMACPGTCDSA